MEIKDEMVEEFKEIAKKKGKEISDQEAREGAVNLAGFFDLLWGFAKKDAIKKKELKKRPEGFPVDWQYSCMVCGNGINPENGWYDEHGPKCLTCQKALRDGIIPTFIFKNRDSYFSEWKIADAFKVRTVTIRKMVREGKLVARTILNESGKIHEQIFLKKENPTLVERYSPERKSYDRNRNKRHDKWARETKKKLMEEWKEKHKKMMKKFNK